MAERVGFEPTVPERAQRFSRASSSTTPAPLHIMSLIDRLAINKHFYPLATAKAHTFLAPASFKTLAHSEMVAPVVITSSTGSKLFPATL